jgi:hypothetical protein
MPLSASASNQIRHPDDAEEPAQGGRGLVVPVEAVAADSIHSAVRKGDVRQRRKAPLLRSS